MSDKKFYITTPIYPSDKLHIGHSYCTVATDVAGINASRVMTSCLHWNRRARRRLRRKPRRWAKPKTVCR